MATSDGTHPLDFRHRPHLAELEPAVLDLLDHRWLTTADAEKVLRLRHPEWLLDGDVRVRVALVLERAANDGGAEFSRRGVARRFRRRQWAE